MPQTTDGSLIAAAEAAPSRATKPDLDWSQVRETVLMLNVAVAQIRNSMTDGDDSVNALTRSFMTMIDRMGQIKSITETMPPSTQRDDLQSIHNDVAAKIDEAIISFQFYDKLTQRLSHVGNSLDQLADLVHDGTRLYSPTAWRALQDIIKSKYTVLADRRMFDLILAGASVEQALSESAELRRTDSIEATDIELF